MRRVNRTDLCLTIVSFPLLAVGAGDTQNAVDGVGSNGIVGGTGHWRGGGAGHWWELKKKVNFWRSHLTASSFELTYGMAGRGERRDGSIRRRVELLLDFGADNPDKVNNRQGSINTAPRASRLQTKPANPWRLSVARHVHLRLCMYKCSIVWALVSSHSGTRSQIANLWALRAISPLLNGGFPMRLGIQSSWILGLEIW